MSHVGLLEINSVVASLGKGGNDVATLWIQREVFLNLVFRPWSYGFVVLAFGGMWGVFHYQKLQRELDAFASSSCFLFGIIAATMAGNYPFWLRSTIDASFGLTAHNTASSDSSLSIALCWWVVGFGLIMGYSAYLFRSIQGKVEATQTGLGH